jgi:hypothetical protein
VTVAPPAIWEILHTAGIDPAPRRTGPTWRQFRHAQATGILAAGFLHPGTMLLKRVYVLVFIEHRTRRDIKFLIRDRGPNFTAWSGAVFQATGSTILRTAVQAPRMKPRVAYCTSWGRCGVWGYHSRCVKR